MTNEQSIADEGQVSVAVEPPRVSAWAIASLAASVGVLCPLLAVIGPLLGVRALVEIKAHPSRRGRGLALAGIWLGVASTIAWIVFVFWWNVNVRHVLRRGPDDALRAAYSGDFSAFREAFIGRGANVSDEEIRTFIDSLRERHGAFVESRQDDMVSQPKQTGERSVKIPIMYTFESGNVRGEVQVLLYARVLAAKLQSITVKDEHGVLMFPADPPSDAGARP